MCAIEGYHFLAGFEVNDSVDEIDEFIVFWWNKINHVKFTPNYLDLKGTSNLLVIIKFNNFICKYFILCPGNKVLHVQFDGGINASLCLCI
jgi:hypothetical protein